MPCVWGRGWERVGRGCLPLIGQALSSTRRYLCSGLLHLAHPSFPFSFLPNQKHHTHPHTPTEQHDASPPPRGPGPGRLRRHGFGTSFAWGKEREGGEGKGHMAGAVTALDKGRSTALGVGQGTHSALHTSIQTHKTQAFMTPAPMALRTGG